MMMSLKPRKTKIKSLTINVKKNLTNSSSNLLMESLLKQTGISTSAILNSRQMSSSQEPLSVEQLQELQQKLHLDAKERGLLPEDNQPASFSIRSLSGNRVQVAVPSDWLSEGLWIRRPVMVYRMETLSQQERLALQLKILQPLRRLEWSSKDLLRHRLLRGTDHANVRGYSEYPLELKHV